MGCLYWPGTKAIDVVGARRGDKYTTLSWLFSGPTRAVVRVDRAWALVRHDLAHQNTSELATSRVEGNCPCVQVCVSTLLLSGSLDEAFAAPSALKTSFTPRFCSCDCSRRLKTVPAGLSLTNACGSYNVNLSSDICYVSRITSRHAASARSCATQAR